MSAEFYSYRPELPDSREASKALWRELVDLQRKAGATWFRFTYFDDSFPSEIYPHGYYLEGWKERPRHQPKFDWPMTKPSQTIEATQ